MSKPSVLHAIASQKCDVWVCLLSPVQRWTNWKLWRETLQSNAYDQSKYADLMKRLQGQVAHLPQADQDKFFMPFVTRNAEYIAIAKRDKDALKVPPSTLAG
jgi:hypothetical protein